MSFEKAESRLNRDFYVFRNFYVRIGLITVILCNTIFLIDDHYSIYITVVNEKHGSIIRNRLNVTIVKF